MHAMWTFAAAVLLTLPLQAAEAQPAEPSGMESLGRELLEGLTPGILQQPAPPDRNSNAPASRLGDLGEDIGQLSGPLSLVRVRQRMQQAESLLAARQASTSVETLHQVGAAQQEVVKQLDSLIAELSKQCQGGNCQPGDKPPTPGQRAQKKPGNSSSASGAGQMAARDSTDRLNQTGAQPEEKGDIDALIRDLWGHLPPRSREQMLQSFSGEFLPEYEPQIEQYYRRLSEEGNNNRPK